MMWINLVIGLCVSAGVTASVHNFKDSVQKEKRVEIPLERQKRVEIPLERQKRQKNKLKVVTVQSDPFAMGTRNGSLEGYIPDLLAGLADVAGFDYSLSVVQDGRYGSPIENGDPGQWNGMIGELVDGVADMAAADLTITSRRGGVVDFSTPFMSSGLSILYKRPRRPSISYNWFIAPFSLEFWSLIVLCMVVCWLLLYLLRRCVPKREHSNRCARECTACCLAYVRMCGIKSDSREPLSVSVLLASWRLFVLLTAGLYLGTLMDMVGSFTNPRMSLPFSSLANLAKQTEVRVGLIHGGSTWTYFKNSKLPVNEGLASLIALGKPTTFVSSVSEGVQRVQEGRYAFIGETQTLEYIASRSPCNVMLVGEEINSNRNLGLAFKKDSPYTERVNSALLKMQEDGMLDKLKNKWFYEMGMCGTPLRYITEEQTHNKRNAMQLGAKSLVKFGSVFVLIAGVAVSLLVASAEIACIKCGGRKRIAEGDEEEMV